MRSQNFSLDKISKTVVRSGSGSVVRPTASRAGAADLGCEDEWSFDERSGSSNSSREDQPAAAEPVDAVRSSMAEPDGTLTLADVLLRVGCYPADRSKRLDLAAQLLVSGHSAQDIAVVAERVISQAGQPRIGLAMLLRLLREPDRLREAVEDCRALRLHEDGRVRRWHPGERDRMRTAEHLEQERRRWIEADREHWIRCRVADGVPQMVAEAEWAARNRQP
jgi:hypothetical protein